jgi:hypothetical protein
MIVLYLTSGIRFIRKLTIDKIFHNRHVKKIKIKTQYNRFSTVLNFHIEVNDQLCEENTSKNALTRVDYADCLGFMTVGGAGAEAGALRGNNRGKGVGAGGG